MKISTPALFCSIKIVQSVTLLVFGSWQAENAPAIALPLIEFGNPSVQVSAPEIPQNALFYSSNQSARSLTGEKE